MSRLNLTPKDLAIHECTGFLPFVLGLLGLRPVKMVTPQATTLYLIVGIRPFRALTTDDLYGKHVVSL